MSTNNRLLWKRVDAKQFGLKTRDEARRLVGESPDKAAALAEYLQFDPDSIGLLLNNSTDQLPFRMTSLLIWGWCQLNGKPATQGTTLQDALRQAISKKLLTCNELASNIGTTERTVSNHWLWDGNRPSRWVEMQLEYQLHQADCWPSPTYLNLPEPNRGLALLLLEGKITLEYAIDMIGVDRELILHWLRGNRNPNEICAGNILALIDLVRSVSGQVEAELKVVEELVEEEPPPSPPAAPQQAAMAMPLFPDLETIITNTVTVLAATLDYFIEHSTQSQREKLRGILGDQMFELKLALVALSSETNWKDRRRGR